MILTAVKAAVMAVLGIPLMAAATRGLIKNTGREERYITIGTVGLAAFLTGTAVSFAILTTRMF